MGAQNALWQSQLAAAAVVNSNIATSMAPTITTTTSSSRPSPVTLSGFAPSDLQALQMALQQQQHNLQQQLQSFLLFQQPNTVQASAVLLQTQVQQAVAQATNQLRLLQRHKSGHEASHHHLPDTPKSIPRTTLEPSNLNDAGFNRREQNNVSMTLSHLTPLPPLMRISTSPTSASDGGRSFPAVSSVSSMMNHNGLQFPFNLNNGRHPPPPPRSPQFPPPGVPRLDLPADENVDLEELEQFAKEFKQRRIKLGELYF